MKTCGTCKHWVGPVEGYQDDICTPLDLDTGEPMEMPFEVRMCCHPMLTICERTPERDGFCITDMSGYKARLCTAVDFGCVRHEAREGA